MQAPVDAWLTNAQLALAQNIIATRFIGPWSASSGATWNPAVRAYWLHNQDILFLELGRLAEAVAANQESTEAYVQTPTDESWHCAKYVPRVLVPTELPQLRSIALRVLMR